MSTVCCNTSVTPEGSPVSWTWPWTRPHEVLLLAIPKSCAEETCFWYLMLEEVVHTRVSSCKPNKRNAQNIITLSSVINLLSAAFDLRLYTLDTLISPLFILPLALSIRLLCFSVRRPRVAAFSGARLLTKLPGKRISSWNSSCPCSRCLCICYKLKPSTLWPAIS